MQRNYELVLLVDSQLQEEGVQKTVERYTDLLSGQGASVHRTDSWGVRKLAYEIRKHQQASYSFVQFQGEPGVLPEVERAARLDDSVLRHLVVAIEELTVDPEPEEAAEEAPAATDAEASDGGEADESSDSDDDNDGEGGEE